MMSAVQSRSTMESRLKVLECHFTWKLDASRSKLFRLRDELEDIGAEVGWMWMGHIFNLQGFVHFQLGFTQDARSFFSRATETFLQQKSNQEGPWLLVNYGNLAWLHHCLGEESQSQRYLLKAEALMRMHPSPSLQDPHPEICAEKAWTLMKFSETAKLQAADYFERAIDMQPERVEWKTCQVQALVNAIIFLRKNLDDDVLEEMKAAKEHDPGNLYLAALYLYARAQRGENIKDETADLAEQVLERPESSCNGINPLLVLYRNHISVDQAVELAEKALAKCPDSRKMKRYAALCYKRMVYTVKREDLEPSTVDRAISLFKEVIELYPHSNLKMKITLATSYSRSKRQAEADQIFTELLGSNQDPEGKQIIYHYYGNHLFYSHKNSNESLTYHMMAAELQHESFYREKSIDILKKIRGGNYHPRCQEVKEFLKRLEGL